MMRIKSYSPPERRPHKKVIFLRGQQAGFLIPLAAFILVGLAALALAMARFSASSTLDTAQEGFAIQAFYAADSGAQYGMNRIFFSAADRASTDANCTNLNGSSLNFAALGLALCSTEISCSISTDSGNTTSFYLVTSDARCGGTDMFAERSIAVSAFMQ